jgi:anaerobic selenocysteine-containing dehydrogenase/Fe-S-cluster-containing dehydrogenase component
MNGKEFSRRQFLKAAGLTGLSAVLNGCSDANRKLIPFVAAPEDIVPGEATWYATTCRECPAGCGMLAKNRDGRVIKVEGNPLHPVNTGKLCARGQASVQGVYNPDRYREPLKRLADGRFVPVVWTEAEKIVLETLTSATGKRAVFLSDLTTGSEREIINRFLTSLGSRDHIMYEPFAYEALRQANADVFGIDAVPSYHIDAADFLISFGANFLETWVSNVAFARQFARFREPGKNGKHPFVYVGPRLSLTGANADHWIAVPPGGQYIVAYGLLNILDRENHTAAFNGNQLERLRNTVREFTPEMVEKSTGVKKEVLQSLATSFMRAKRPLALAEGMTYQDPEALRTAQAANLLSSFARESMGTIDFGAPSSLSGTLKAKEMKQWVDLMNSGGVDILFILRANPTFHLPKEWQFSEAVKKMRLVVSLGSFPDETSQLAHLIMPTHTFLESWGDYSPSPDVHGLMQAVMGPVFPTRPVGDILLSLGRSLRGEKAFPEKDSYELLRRSWASAGGKARSTSIDTETEWQEALKRGGSFSAGSKPQPKPAKRQVFRTGAASPGEKGGKPTGVGLSFVSYPTVQFFDGRMANRPFMQELPDPISAITWSGWAEINPETARRLGVKIGDILTIRSESGTLHVPAYPYSGIEPGTIAMPVGRGHTTFGRYASNETGNPSLLCKGDLDEAGGLLRALPLVTVTKAGRSIALAHTDGSSDQHGRDIVRSVRWNNYVKSADEPPDVVLPLSSGFTKERDFYPPHRHDAYRWGMAVDLDRCIGCGACVAACYAENNVAVVGKEQVIKGREMAWLHVQRYVENEEPFVRFLPMLCQHCDEAPCEAVCPVFAPTHNKDGINNQTYNRCIGTRFCSQNCPYKIRRFNWFTWKHDPPLEWQLNPDVTVRTKGVMEKCSFCIQRIVEAKIRARSENRLVHDGEISPACVQTCPADALTFGNLKDPRSRVSTLVRQARAYQVLGELNTKPGVIYLKRITQQFL